MTKGQTRSDWSSLRRRGEMSIPKTPYLTIVGRVPVDQRLDLRLVELG